MDVTSQPRPTAYLQIREPRKPFPPQTMSFLAADMMDELGELEIASSSYT